jgi:hypothetical protein
VTAFTSYGSEYLSCSGSANYVFGVSFPKLALVAWISSYETLGLYIRWSGKHSPDTKIIGSFLTGLSRFCNRGDRYTNNSIFAKKSPGSLEVSFESGCDEVYPVM